MTTGKVLRVLFVEDNEGDVQLLLRALRKGGYEVTAHRRVQTAQALEEALSKGEWDLILSDYHMPLLSGLTAFLLMKLRDRDIPFVLVSGTLGPQLAAVAQRVGVHQYLLKEHVDEKLIPALERAMRDVAHRRQGERPE